IVLLTDAASQEIGPAVLRPNGTVFATGATGHNAVYNTGTGQWSAGPDFPFIPGQGQLDIADGPAALLPSGNVLAAASPGIFQVNPHFFEFDGAILIDVPSPPHAPAKSSYEWRFLVLPTGQIMATDGTSDVEIYTPAGTFQNAWRPTITNAPTS